MLVNAAVMFSLGLEIHIIISLGVIGRPCSFVVALRVHLYFFH